MKSIILILIQFALIASLTGCGSGSSDPTPESDSTAVNGVTLSLPATTLNINDTATISVAITPNNATNQDVTWVSDNTDVATIDASGLLTAVSAGSAVITATTSDGSFTDTINIDVVEQQTAFSLQSPVLSEGQAMPITYTCDGDGISPALSWGSAPEGTTSFALIMDHIPPEGDNRWYWIMYDIPVDVTSIGDNETVGTLGNNVVNGLNEYSPPCSQGPGLKEYTFTLYALSDAPDLTNVNPVNQEALLSAIENITVEATALNVTYEREEEMMASSCEAIEQSVLDSGFSDVSVTCDMDYAYVTSDTYPSHDLMNGITGTNEQIPVPALNYAAPIKLAPQIANSVTSIDAALGVAVNGVPIYDYSAQGELDPGEYDPRTDTVLLGQLDNCSGHAGRGDDYHYHASPTCMIEAMANQGDAAIIGWGYDGYPIYGNNNPDGTIIAATDLDVCNGQADDTFGYRYHTSTEPPYIIQCLVGEVDTAILPRVSPLSGDTTGARANLMPPQGGVENLNHTISEDGTRLMTYDYQGEAYYVRYSPSVTLENCYDFEQRTISNGGIIENGTYCRTPQEDMAAAPEPGAMREFKLEVWADNWFAAYLGDVLIIEDSVSIDTERSFNSETTEFDAEYPLHLNFIVKDFKENDTGLEYIGLGNQQMGDGGIIAQITNTADQSVVAVTDSNWKCQVIHEAPLDKSCESSSDPIAGVAPCDFISIDEPANWKSNAYDDSDWPYATEHTATAVDPKDGYDDIVWDTTARFIWGPDLETNNTLLCRVTINAPAP